MVEKLFWMIGGLVVGTLFGLFVKEPLSRWLDKRRQLKKLIKKGIVVNVHQLWESTPVGEYSGLVTDENKGQRLFEFRVPLSALVPSKESLASLRNAAGKRDFIETVSSLLAGAGAGGSGAVDAPLGKGSLLTPRDVVLTDIPIPGNYYGWNTADRSVLVISTSSVSQFFGGKGQSSISAFFRIMLMRMSIFSTVTELDPRINHSDNSRGCLFDFTIRLQDVQALVRRPFICPACLRLIAGCCGTDFSLQAKEWVEAAVTDV